jgi:hypothetical protein
LIPYAAHTSNLRNLAGLRRAGWRVLLSPATRLNPRGLRYALDNGAWSAFKAGEAFKVEPFERAVAKIGADADFVVAPDIVAGGLPSLALSVSWIPQLLAVTRVVLIAVQDGMTPADVRPYLSERVGIFVGGSTEWKLATMKAWGELAREVGCVLHIARVNTMRRIRLCASVGATSFDGSSASRFAVTLPLLDHARKQPDLFA